MIIQKRYLFWLVFLFLFFITVQSQDASAQLLPIDSSCVNSGYICDNCSSITWDCFDIGSCTNIPIASRPYYCLAPWMNYCANNYSCGCNYTQVVRIFYPDTDGDGYGAGTSVLKCYDGITVPPGFSLNNLDCNNNNASIYPGAVEKCNNVDDNCNGVTDEGCDDDADTYADSSMVCEGSFRDDLNNLQLCSTHGGDCDDGNLNIHPGAPEICNNIDESCNGVKDDGCDDDGDTYPDCSMSCTTQDYWSTGNNSLRECGVPADCDCDDNNIALWFWRNYYVDSDGDGYGCGNLVSVCSGNGPPPGYSASNGDCNCTNPTVWTLMFAYNDTDRDDYGCGGLVNQSCSNGTTPPAGYTLTPGDCDCNVYSCNNGANNCSIMSYLDFDNDSFGNATVSHRKCDALANYVLNNTDCDDSVFFCNAGANNCTAINYLDTDQDRYCDSPTVSLRRCDAPPLYNVTNISMCTDCNNTNQLIWRNGSFYRDFDNDTFGVNPSLNICYGLLDPPSGYSYNNTDCDDSVFSCNTGANNCTAMNYLDTDQDRYCDSPTVSLRRCDAPPLYNVTNISMCTDCNNTNQLIWRNGTFCVNKDGDAYGLPPLVIVCYGALDPPINYSYSCVDCDDSVPNTWGVGNLVVKYKGSTVAAIDNYGVLALKGGVSVVDPITGIPPSFNVKDDVGDVVSAITSAGDLYTILGVTNMFSSPIVPTASQDLIIKRSGTNLAMFTKRGAVQVRCVMPNFNFSGTPIG